MRAVLEFAEILEKWSRGLASGPGSLKVRILSVNRILNLNETHIKLSIMENQLVLAPAIWLELPSLIKLLR